MIDYERAVVNFYRLHIERDWTTIQIDNKATLYELTRMTVHERKTIIVPSIFSSAPSPIPASYSLHP